MTERGAHALEDYAAATGVDLEALLNAASRHFESGEILPRSGALSDSEMAPLVEEDWADFGADG